MDKVSVKLQVFFNEPFWVGVFERTLNGEVSAYKVIFGAEPKDYEIEEFILENYYKLQFSPFIETDKDVIERMNPKRLQREVKKQILNIGIGTKAQQALKLQQEQRKTERKIQSKEQREADKQFQFELKQQKRKAKHKGR